MIPALLAAAAIVSAPPYDRLAFGTPREMAKVSAIAQRCELPIIRRPTGAGRIEILTPHTRETFRGIGCVVYYAKAMRVRLDIAGPR